MRTWTIRTWLNSEKSQRSSIVFMNRYFDLLSDWQQSGSLRNTKNIVRCLFLRCFIKLEVPVLFITTPLSRLLKDELLAVDQAPFFEGHPCSRCSGNTIGSANFFRFSLTLFRSFFFLLALSPVLRSLGFSGFLSFSAFTLKLGSERLLDLD